MHKIQFFSCHQVGKLNILSPQLFQPTVQAVRDQSLPWGVPSSVWWNQLCFSFWIQNFGRIPHLGMSLVFGVGRRLRGSVWQNRKLPSGRGLGTDDGKHRGYCPYHLVRKRAQLELCMNWAGSRGGMPEQELTLFHAKRCTEVVLNRGFMCYLETHLAYN